MKACKRWGKFVVALVFFTIGAAIFGATVFAQNGDWQIIRADYGVKSDRADVTDRVLQLISGAGLNSRFKVNNQNMGGDPAVGKDKRLRIFAVNRNHEEREFNYKEGETVDAGTFNTGSYRGGDFRGGDFRREDDRWNDLQITKAFYGVKGKTVDVTDVLRSMVRDGALTLPVRNDAMGGDPAVGRDKVLIVVYRYRGQEQAAAVSEGDTLRLP